MPIDSLVSILPHPGPPSCGDPMKGSRTGAGQPKGAWHPPRRFALGGRADPGATPHCTPSSPPPGSSAGGSPRLGLPPPPGQRFPASRPRPLPGPCPRFPHLPPPGFSPLYPLGCSRPRRPPSTWPRDRRSPPFSLQATELRLLYRLSRENNLYLIYPERGKVTKKKRRFIITLIIF